MKRWIALALLVALPVACGGAREQAIDTTTLRVGNGGEPKSLDPHLVTGLIEERLLSSLFEGLTNVDLNTMQAIPGVAERWDVTPDGLLYTFYLRPDARWSNGDPLTAQDFAYSWQRMLSPALAAEYAYMFYLIDGAEAFNSGTTRDFGSVGIRVVDDRTIEVRLRAPAPYFLILLSHFSFYPVHRATIEAHGKMTDRDTAWTRPGNHVSNGPFALSAWTPSKELVAVKNKYYWGSASVKLERVLFLPIQDPSVEERMFRAGELDITNQLPSAKVEVYQKENPEQLRIDPSIATEFVRFNTTRKPFNDPRVRLAFALAIDRQSIVEHVMRAGQMPATTFVPPNLGGYEYGAHAGGDAPKRHTFDPEAARTLLAEAGYAGGAGFPAVAMIYDTNDNNRRYCEALQNMWKKQLGVDVQLQNSDGKTWLARMIALDYDLARSFWVADYPDPSNFLEMFRADSGNNRTGYSDDAYEGELEQSARASDPAERNRLFDAAERRLLTAAPITPVYYQTRPFLKSPRVTGMTPNNLNKIDWRGLALTP